MLEITCKGTPYEIGYQHGSQAASQIKGSISFYTSLFQQNVKISWPEVQKTALEFETVIRKNWPEYLEEMRGIADGAGKTLSDIIALNVRTEINFGLFSDGCTALSWLHEDSSILAQNWDWMTEQKANLILLTIEQSPKPTIKMVTEAGLIGKIGLNSSGVGVCLNAIRAKGMDASRIPCHLALRLILDSNSLTEAVDELKKFGVASSCHMLIADANGSVGLEWSYKDLQVLKMNERNQVFHSNHYLVEHPGVEDTVWIEDSKFRIKRIQEICEGLGDEPTVKEVQELFKDEKNYPFAICRAEEQGNHSGTLFNIVMDLKARKASVILGRPTEPEGLYEIGF
ncbi:AAT-domain-containing protein [Aureobasidium pullulans EXF-150]|uniref:AAT-domain-containing protein n=1 Tax=Aureobasidium pullulans EXF-150 TaxID=1043002 RepID=A0A074XQV7_AURPU|nr:AAT-domain-containing protein [Aureobasidium pullulans EXF-150]KEQ87968.1 AAT-domain-containing protein [Aureobasidium pullulans EXF-150]